MPQRDKAPPGAPCWIDLFSSDPDRAIAFYGELFGWAAEAGGEEYGGYITFSKDGLPVAGCMRNDGQSPTPDVWSVYLASGDAQATVEAATARGAQVIVAPMEVPRQGTMAVVTDAGQAAVGIWQPDAHPGFRVLREPGSPAWFELHTRDYQATVEFYRQVFGWDTHVMSDTDEFRYTTLGEGESAEAGIMDDASAGVPESVPPHWAVYFAVEDADAALEKVVELGGAVQMPAEDTPYGRLGVAVDPTGAAFRVVAG